MSIAIADERPSRRSVARAGRRLARPSKPPKRCRCATNNEAACLRSRKPPVMMRLPRHQTSHPDRRALLIQIVAVHLPMEQGFLYLIAIMDWHSRKVLSWRLSTTQDTAFCIEALEEALERYGCPEI